MDEVELINAQRARIAELEAELAENNLQRQTRLFAEYSSERCRRAEARIAVAMQMLADMVDSSEEWMDADIHAIRKALGK